MNHYNEIYAKAKDYSKEKTIGIIICKKDNEFVMEYCSDDKIFRTIYKLN